MGVQGHNRLPGNFEISGPISSLRAVIEEWGREGSARTLKNIMKDAKVIHMHVLLKRSNYIVAPAKQARQYFVACWL